MRRKRASIAFLLGFFFGPLAFFYAGWRAGVASLLAFVPGVFVQLCLVWADFTLKLPVLEIEHFWGLGLVIVQQLCFGLLCSVWIPNDDPSEQIEDRLLVMGYLWWLILSAAWALNDLVIGLCGVLQSPHDWSLLWFFLMPHPLVAGIAYAIAMMIVWAFVHAVTLLRFKPHEVTDSSNSVEALAAEGKIVTCPKCGARNRVFAGDGRRYRCGQCKTPI